MTPQLQMAIKLLQLSRLELLDTIQQELEENPALEETQDDADDRMEIEPEPEAYESDTPAEKEVTIEEKINSDIDWSNYIDEYNTPGRHNLEYEEKDSPKYESFIAQKESLIDHLLWQIGLSPFSDDDKNIAALIVGNLDVNGYLAVDVQDIAVTAGCSEDKVHEVLSVVQTFDPVGVCARDLKECLLIQADHIQCKDRLVYKIIENHLVHLENKNYNAICRALKVKLEEVVAAVNIIKAFEPMPGRLYNDENPQYISPDIYVYKLEDDFVIFLNDDGLPRLRISNIYQHSMNSSGKMSRDARDYMQEKLKSAAWLIKSIHQRQKTIYRVMESILKFQRDFFEKGIDHLKPMVLRDIADDIEMHESTISRVTTNKYAYTPQGLFELKFFFNSSINRMHGEAMASASVQDKIRHIIDTEDTKKPYSDDKISAILKRSNIDIARRTVAKYREMMRILPSNKRKQI